MTLILKYNKCAGSWYITVVYETQVCCVLHKINATCINLPPYLPEENHFESFSNRAEHNKTATHNYLTGWFSNQKAKVSRKEWTQIKD